MKYSPRCIGFFGVRVEHRQAEPAAVASRRLPGREPGSGRLDAGAGQFAGRHSSEARGHRAGVVPRTLGRDQLGRTKDK